jgi:hypothetical protein
MHIAVSTVYCYSVVLVCRKIFGTIDSVVLVCRKIFGTIEPCVYVPTLAQVCHHLSVFETYY